MGMLTGEAREKAQAALDATYALLDAAEAVCRHCKAAKTRAAREGKPLANVRCGGHKTQRGLVYVTSPLSETYWAS